MKSNVHPTYYSDTAVKCVCGNTFVTGSTLKTISVDLCSKCHPFFTGEVRFVDTLGNVDKFLKKQAAASNYTKKTKKTKETASYKTLKEMLTTGKK